MGLRVKLLTTAAMLLMAGRAYVPAPARILRAGEISFAEGTQLSHNFSVCTVLILDYGSSSVMGHALLDSQIYDTAPYPDFYLHVGNVVDKAVEELKRRGIDPKKTKAYIDTGTAYELLLLQHNLSLFGIKIAEARIENDTYTERSVEFDSIDNKMKVYRTPRLNDIKK